jgi:uncharacterized membrane protein
MNKAPKIKKIGLFILIIGFIAAGINHFRVPAFYIGIIPSWLPYPSLLNIAAGTCEILFGLLLIFSKTRRIAAWCIILMLIAFLPVHVAMLRGYTHIGSLVVMPVLAWLRLVLQFVLIRWIWQYTRKEE